jgi:hypothetical protein
MGEGKMEKIYWLLMNFPDNLLTSCTSIERSNQPPVTLKKCYINTGIVTFETQILCVSPWIMGQGQMKNIYWLLMNFPDKLLTSCTSIEQSNIPSSHIGKICCISTRIVTFQTHILCVSSWIMGDRMVNQIYYFLWTFQINFSRVVLLLNRATYLPVTLEKCCINRGIVTFHAHILRVSSWIMGEGQMNIIYQVFMNLPDNLLMNCTSFEQVNLPTFQFHFKNDVSTQG